MENKQEELHVCMPSELSKNVSRIADDVRELFHMHETSANTNVTVIMDFKQSKTVDISGLTSLHEKINMFKSAGISFEFRNVCDEIYEVLDLVGLVENTLYSVTD
jgi:ABC-type transporter Mla MlaB component